MAHDQLDAFRKLVLDNSALQTRLRETLDRRAFIEQMIQLGAEHGYQFTAEEIEQAVATARREWSQRRSIR